MNKKLLLIDAHAHIQECYDINLYISSIIKNFSNVVKNENLSDKWIGVIFLTEVKGLNYFDKLKSKEAKDRLKENDFSVNDSLEDNSIILSDNKQHTIIIIAGKQIITEKNIEVLALGTTSNFEYGNSIEKTITKIQECGAIPVLPWGVGKWLGRRKEILIKYMEANSSKTYFLGDNGGRPIFWPKPKIFSKGIELNHFVLPGSDALAIPSENTKTGSYGFMLESEIDLDKPAASIMNYILTMNKQPATFGHLESPLRFLSNQIIMQLRKHIK